MAQMQVFVSHSHEDDAFCRVVVAGLRGAGADVWYDEQSMGAGHLLDVIQHEILARPVFIVILSKAAFNSMWVTQECQWAFNLYQREPDRVILPVTAQAIEPSDFNTWLFLENFKRIEASGYKPLPQSEAIAQTLHTLVLTPAGKVSPAASNNPAPRGETVAVPWPIRPTPTVLWVDDNPSNNIYERRSLERLGITFTLSTSTDDALGKLVRHRYDVIISDMSRPPDNLAGYELLDEMRKLKISAPFILYSSAQHPQRVAESKRRGAYGQTGAPDELFQLVTSALGLH